MMRKYAIVVAGGSGTRMNSNLPKQFLELEGKPIVVHTIEKFLWAETVEIILVLPEAYFPEWEAIRSKYFSTVNVNVTAGGTTRAESVKAGLKLIEGNGVVAIHDAVRPYISPELINQCYQSAIDFGSGVAAVDLKDSIRKKKGQAESEARDRTDYVLVQTPQTFEIGKIKKAYELVADSYSDDASVFEAAGNKVYLVPGDYGNIKITTPEDLK